MRWAFLVMVLLVGCKTTPKEPTITLPEVIRVPVKTYVPVPDALLKLCSWRSEGLPSEVFELSNERKQCLLRYEKQLETIRKIEGTTEAVE